MSAESKEEVLALLVSSAHQEPREQETEQEHDQDTKPRFRKPRGKHVDAAVALMLKQFELQEDIQEVLRRNAGSPVVAVIAPFVESAAKEVAALRAHFHFKRPVAMQYAVVILAEQCTQASREQIRELFQCKTITLGIRTLRDLRMAINKHPASTATVPSEWHQIKIAQPDTTDWSLAGAIMHTINEHTMTMHASLQTIERLARTLQIYAQFHAHKPCACASAFACRKALKTIIARQFVISPNCAYKAVSYAQTLVANHAEELKKHSDAFCPQEP